VKQAAAGYRATTWSMIRAALAAVEPGSAVRRFVNRTGDRLVVGKQSYNLEDYRRVRVIGAGKAGAPMTRALVELLPDRIVDGLVIVKHGHVLASSPSTQPVEIVEAGHPLPDLYSLQHTQRLVELIADSTEQDLLFCLVSGGGSALLTLPAKPVELQHLQALTKRLLACGAKIGEINVVRKHLSRVKGGWLARLAAPATVVSLILSDVVGDPLDIIASGPTVPDPSSYADALAIVDKYGLRTQAGPSQPEAETELQASLAHLQAGAVGQFPETPKPGDLVFSRVQNVIIGNNRLAAEAAVEAARADGLKAVRLNSFIEGEAREVGKIIASLARNLARNENLFRQPACLVLGGETTVTLRGDGLGGRCQEMALSAAIAVAGCSNILIACFGTDGNDGPTDAAGALADGQTVARARALGLDAGHFLARNDSYCFFQALDDLIITGPTNTNVNDLTFILAWSAADLEP
jgi:glycerate 2-kinase